jgi:hypothetical protein
MRLQDERGKKLGFAFPSFYDLGSDYEKLERRQCLCARSPVCSVWQGRNRLRQARSGWVRSRKPANDLVIGWIRILPEFLYTFERTILRTHRIINECHRQQKVSQAGSLSLRLASTRFQLIGVGIRSFG